MKNDLNIFYYHIYTITFITYIMFTLVKIFNFLNFQSVVNEKNVCIILICSDFRVIFFILRYLLFQSILVDFLFI